MKKILFINPHFPLFSTPTCGGANRSQMFLKALTRVGHVDVVSFWENEESNLPYCKVIHSGCPKIGSTDSFGRIEKFVRLLAPWNANNIFPLNRSIESFCDEWIAKGNYDYIVVRYLFTAAEYGLLKYADRLIVDVDDNPKNTLLVEAKGQSEQLQKIYKYMAAYSATVMCRIILKKVCCSFYSNINQVPSEKSIYLPNVAIDNKPCKPLGATNRNRILIVGFMTYWVNREGVERFLKNIFPLVRKRVSDVEVRVVGKNDDDMFVKFVDSIPNARAVGYVDDLHAEYENCSVVAVPIYNGSGTCVKVIEAMHKNRAYVSTPIGIRGLDVVPGRDCMVARNDREFAEQLVTLLQQKEVANLIAASALNYAREKFSHEAFMNIVKSNIKFE